MDSRTGLAKLALVSRVALPPSWQFRCYQVSGFRGSETTSRAYQLTSKALHNLCEQYTKCYGWICARHLADMAPATAVEDEADLEILHIHACCRSIDEKIRVVEDAPAAPAQRATVY